MIDLGEFDARDAVRSSAEEQEAVFARHRARVQAFISELDKKPECANKIDFDGERVNNAQNG